MAEVYNYQKALKQDIVIRKISGDMSLPVGISLKPFVIFIVSFLAVYLLFHDPLKAFYRVNSGLGKLVYVGVYIGIPIGLVTLANRLKPDGLGLVQYGVSISAFGIKKILSRTVYYHDCVLPTGYFEASYMADTVVLVERGNDGKKPLVNTKQ